MPRTTQKRPPPRRGRPARRRPPRGKRYGTNEKRGRLAGKRHISERPAVVERRRQAGHWKIDTVNGTGSKHCVVTLAERVSGYVRIGKLRDHSVAALNHRTIKIVRQSPHLYKTATADNGTEFHGYEEIERATGIKFYFATPYHSWERGTNENTNGLIRQYLPKGRSMKHASQARCEEIERALNNRPRKRLSYRTPLEYLEHHRLFVPRA
jgi:transposase, IS30 family